MSRTIYVNGRYLRRSDAAISAEDRGFLFGDAVYEVCEVRDGRIIDETRHLGRLQRSLAEIRMPMPMAPAALGRVLRETIRRNRVHDGMVFLQVSRGVGLHGREFQFPPEDVPQTLVVTARPHSRAANEQRAQKGIAVQTVADNRWGRCDIKTAMLLPASLAKEDAKAAGADEAWFVDANGLVTEGASSNAWIVDAEGRLRTRALGPNLLRGITRTTLLDVCAAAQVTLHEEPFTVAEAQAAREAFISSATTIVLPVVAIDGTTIGDGRPGPLSRRLRALFHEIAESSPR
jgi:D-alanine transaminase